MYNKVKINLFAFITVLLWGSGFPFTRAIGDQISSYSLGFIRCFLAAIIGFLMLGEVPDMGTYIGGAIIIISVIVFSQKGEAKGSPSLQVSID